MFTKFALAALLRILDPTHHYTLSEMVAANPYTVTDLQQNLDRQQACQCLTLKISPDGMVMGEARPCACGE